MRSPLPTAALSARGRAHRDPRSSRTGRRAKNLVRVHPVGDHPITAIAIDPGSDAIYFHGSGLDGDGGIWVLDSATGSVKVLREGSHEPGGRTALILSPSGTTLLSGFCDYPHCQLDVVDLTTGEVRRASDAFALFDATDDFVLGFAGPEDRPRPWRLLNLSDGSTRSVAADLINTTDTGYVIDEEHLLLSGPSADGHTYNIVAVDLASGAERLVLAQPSNDDTRRLRRALVHPDWAVISTQPVVDLVDLGGGTMDVLDLQTGQVLPAKATIGN